MNYWLHRVSHHAEVSYPLLEKNKLTIGFSDFSNQEFIDSVLSGKTQDERWNLLEKAFDETWGNRTRNRHSLWRYIDGMKKGDWVVVPTYWGAFSVYEIDGMMPKPIKMAASEQLKDGNNKPLFLKENLFYRKEEHDKDTLIELGFYWDVKPIATNISREKFADAPLTARMKIRGTNSCITNIKESVKRAVEAFKLDKPINLHRLIIESTAVKILGMLKDQLNPNKLETLIKWYFQKIGASETFIPAKNERDKSGDADVTAVFESIKTIIYIQAKFHENTTSDDAIKQIIDYKNYKEDSLDDEYTRACWVISTADKFTEESEKRAREEKVQLINGIEFTTMLLNVGISNLDEIFK